MKKSCHIVLPPGSTRRAVAGALTNGTVKAAFVDVNDSGWGGVGNDVIFGKGKEGGNDVAMQKIPIFAMMMRARGPL